VGRGGPLVDAGADRPQKAVNAVAFGPGGLLATGADDHTCAAVGHRHRAAGRGAPPVHRYGARRRVEPGWDGARHRAIRDAELQSLACRVAHRNLTAAERRRFLGPDVPYAPTCA
jgi:hypothetical protein